MTNISKYSEDMARILKCCFEVHKTLRGGLLEPIYQECLAIELSMAEVPFEREKLLQLTYKGAKINKEYKADFVCYNQIVVELKAVEYLKSEHRMQLFNYLRMTQKPIGILVNFGIDGLEFEKYGYNADTNKTFVISRYPSEEESEERYLRRVELFGGKLEK